MLSRAGVSAAMGARMDRLPLTSYQRGIFLVIATAWFFDLTPAGAGLISSMSFIGMFLGASTAGLLALYVHHPNCASTPQRA